MFLRSGNTDRLKRVPLIKRISNAAALRWFPVDGVVSELDGGKFDLARNGAAMRSGAGEQRRARRLSCDRRGGACDRRGHRQGCSRRNVADYPVEQGSRVACHPGRSRECRRIVRRDAVNDREAGLGCRALAGPKPAPPRPPKHPARPRPPTPKRLAPREVLPGGWLAATIGAPPAL